MLPPGSAAPWHASAPHRGEPSVGGAARPPPSPATSIPDPSPRQRPVGPHHRPEQPTVTAAAVPATRQAEGQDQLVLWPLAPPPPPFRAPLCLLALQPELGWDPVPGGRVRPNPTLTFDVPAFLPDLVHEPLWGGRGVSGLGGGPARRQPCPSQVPSVQPPQGDERRGRPGREGPQWRRGPGPRAAFTPQPPTASTAIPAPGPSPGRVTAKQTPQAHPRPPQRYLGCARR